MPSNKHGVLHARNRRETCYAQESAHLAPEVRGPAAGHAPTSPGAVPPLVSETARRFAAMATAWEAGGTSREHVDECRRLGHQIKALRTARRLNRGKFAELTEIAPELLYYLEMGLATEDEIAQSREVIAEVLGVKGAELSARLAMARPSGPPVSCPCPPTEGRETPQDQPTQLIMLV